MGNAVRQAQEVRPDNFFGGEMVATWTENSKAAPKGGFMKVLRIHIVGLVAGTGSHLYRTRFSALSRKQGFDSPGERH